MLWRVSEGACAFLSMATLCHFQRRFSQLLINCHCVKLAAPMHNNATDLRAGNARSGQSLPAEGPSKVPVQDEALPKVLRLGPNVVWRREMP